jgi:catechol 2,3-dioxygenase-like lactoylglutathione lyase family enzyme
MVFPASFTHVNLVARDWRRLARFYEQVLGCVPVPPERNLQGEELDRATGVQQATIQGAHLRLPGMGETGPTLEIFEYGQHADSGPAAVNRPGFAHIAFAVDDIRAARDAVLSAGGGSVGDVVTLFITETRSVTFAYVTDPEGNIIELQRWLDQTAA